MVAPHRAVARHLCRVAKRWTPAKVIVSLGVFVTVVLAEAGMPAHATAVGIIVNLIWIWE